MARANLIDVGRPSRDHFWPSGASTRSPRWAACCGRPRSASGAAQPSSFGGSRVKLDFCHWVTVTMWGCPREK